MTIIILLGAPGVGKGTQAKLLADKYDLTILSIGEILRHAVKEKTKLGIKVEESINNGDLVSDDIVCSLIESKIVTCNDNGYILDGFPRTIMQAKKLDLICMTNNLSKLQVITLMLSKEEVLKRLLSRFYCSGCNQSYNSITNPTQIKGVCDKCSNNIFYNRVDDKKEVINSRLLTYLHQTKPIINFYKERESYYSIEADQSIDIIYNKLSFFLNQSMLR